MIQLDMVARKLEDNTGFEPSFTNDERRALRKMLREFAMIKTACPTARRELGD